MCTEDHVTACTDTTCTEDFVSACTYVSTESTGVQRRTCPYISTKGTGVHVVTSMHKSKVKTVVRGRTKEHDNIMYEKNKREIIEFERSV